MRETLFVVVVLGLLVDACFAAVKDLDENAEKQWVRHTLPLPHEIAIRKANVVPPVDIGIRLAEGAGDVEQNAVAQLKQFIKDQTGVEPIGSAFEIVIGVLDRNGRVCGRTVENAERLKTLPNNEQAYLIQPVGDTKLVLAALHPKGLFYAVQTLKQLLGRNICKDSVSVPLAAVTDWPDMDQRGLWKVGHTTPGLIPWLASLKLNFAQFGTGIILKKGARAQCPTLPMEQIIEARNSAFLLMPHLSHFDYWWRYGRDDVYPELVGKGDGARNPCYTWGGAFEFCRCPCLATPLLKRLVTEWIESAAEQGVRDFSLWLTEHTCHCECEACLKDGPRQMQRETGACVEAVMAARRKYPFIRGRIFFTMLKGDAIKDSYECLKMLPPQITAERVYGRNEAFDKYAADGHWLATYSGPRVGPGYFTTRYMADELKKTIRDYYDAKYRAIYCLGRRVGPSEVFGHWERAFCNYQYSAVAEWTWNVNGRDMHEFALAWATTNTFAYPEDFAAWIEVIRPVESLVRYWELTQTSNWLKAADKLSNGKSTPAWSARLPKPAELQEMLAKCDRALPIAEKVEDRSVLLETQYLRTSLQAMVQFRDLYRQCSNTDQDLRRSDRALKESAEKFNALLDELQRLCDALMTTPEVDPAYGPQKAMEYHNKWKKALREKVSEKVWGRTDR